MPKPRPRVLIGDDHALLLDGIRALLARDYEVVATAADGRQLLDSALRLRPDVVVSDVSMPALNGIEAARQIKAVLPSTKVVFLTMHTNPIYLRKALEAGAGAYVLKAGASEELLRAISAVLSGRNYFSPSLELSAGPGLSPNRLRPSAGADLTARQIEILQLIAEGRINKEIAHILNISLKTVEFHRGRIMARLGVHTVGEMVRVAIEQNLITPATGGSLAG